MTAMLCTANQSHYKRKSLHDYLIILAKSDKENTHKNQLIGVSKRVHQGNCPLSWDIQSESP